MPALQPARPAAPGAAHAVPEPRRAGSITQSSTMALHQARGRRLPEPFPLGIAEGHVRHRSPAWPWHGAAARPLPHTSGVRCHPAGRTGWVCISTERPWRRAALRGRRRPPIPVGPVHRGHLFPGSPARSFLCSLPAPVAPQAAESPPHGASPAGLLGLPQLLPVPGTQTPPGGSCPGAVPGRSRQGASLPPVPVSVGPAQSPSPPAVAVGTGSGFGGYRASPGALAKRGSWGAMGPGGPWGAEDDKDQ